MTPMTSEVLQAAVPLPTDAQKLRDRLAGVLENAERLLKDAVANDAKCKAWDERHVEELRADLTKNCFEVHGAKVADMEFYQLLLAKRREPTKRFIAQVKKSVNGAKNTDALRRLINECNASASADFDEASLAWGRRMMPGDEDDDEDEDE